MLKKEDYMRIDGMRIEGKTWAEIKDKLNNEFKVNYDESAYRKPYTAYKRGLEDSVVDTDFVEQMQRIEIEKKKLSVLRGANGEIVRDLALRELYQEQILEAISSLPSIRYNTDIKHRAPNEEDKYYEYVMILSDLHYDGDFNLEEIFTHILEKTQDYIEKNKISAIDIAELGDVIEGASLRPSQLRGIKTGMIPQIITVSEHYCRFLEQLQVSTGVYIEFHTVTSSNHTQLRPLNTKRNELPDEDLMQVFYSFLKERFKDNPMIYINGDEDIIIELIGRSEYKKPKTTKMFLSHGHKYKLTPNTLVSVSKNISMYQDEIYDYYGYGHYHQYRDMAIDKSNGKDSRAFLFPALAPKKDSYERLGLMGCAPAFTILTFLNGTHEKTELFRSISYD